MKKSLIPFVFIAVAVMAIISCKTDANPNAKSGVSKTTLVNGRVVVASPTTNNISVSGTIMSDQEVTLQSQISGLVTKVYFSEGSHVQKGDLLVKIDDSQFQAQMQKDEVAKQLDEITEARQKKLLAINGISEQDYDIALNTLNSVIADMKLIQVSINYTNIVAPFDGTIGLKNISDGSYVTPSTVIANLEEVTPIKIDFFVPEIYLSKLQKDETIDFTVSGSTNQFKGKIYAIDPKVDMSTGSVHVRAITDNKDGLLLPGQFANISIILNHVDSALMIPSEAIIPKTIGQSVYMAKNGKAHTVDVTIGIRTDSTVEITKGLHAGDTIITDGTMLISNGTSVKFKQIR